MVEDAETLMEAVEENIFAKQETLNYHLLTELTNLLDDAESEIREWLLTQGTLFHRKARKYLSKFDKDIRPSLAAKPCDTKVILGGFSRVIPGEEIRVMNAD